MAITPPSRIHRQSRRSSRVPGTSALTRKLVSRCVGHRLDEDSQPHPADRRATERRSSLREPPRRTLTTFRTYLAHPWLRATPRQMHRCLQLVERLQPIVSRCRREVSCANGAPKGLGFGDVPLACQALETPDGLLVEGVRGADHGCRHTGMVCAYRSPVKSATGNRLRSCDPDAPVEDLQHLIGARRARTVAPRWQAMCPTA